MIRLARPDDLTAVVAIYNETIPSRMVTADTQTVSVDEKRDWFFGHTELRPLFVYEIDGEVCGWLSFKSFYGRPAYQGTVEISIYVAEKARGQGLGRSLLAFAEQHARGLHIHTLLAFIFSHNTPSLALFKRFEFSVWGELPNVAEMDGKPYSLTILGKRIDGAA